jgi:hypothetical protein
VGPDGRNSSVQKTPALRRVQAATCQAESITSEKTVPLSPVDRLSPRALARIAGGLYLVNIVFGAFAIGNAPWVPDLSRWSVAAHLVVGLTNPPLALIFYELCRVVGRRLALLNVFFTIVATAIEMVIYGFADTVAQGSLPCWCPGSSCHRWSASSPSPSGF